MSFSGNTEDSLGQTLHKPKSTVLNRIGCTQRVIRGEKESKIEKGWIKRQRRDLL